jgi:DNA-binding PadR family transcriptional regulator
MKKAYLSFSATVIFQAVASGYQYGFDIMDITGLPGGTVYPALRRLEEMAYVRSKWEKQQVAQKEQRPPRKYYEVTGDGADALQESVKRYRLLERSSGVIPRQSKPSRGRA